MVILLGLRNFFEHLGIAMSNIFFFIMTILVYLLGYPAQVAILITALVLFVLDIITKIYAISINNKGIINAFKIGKLSSKGFWQGFLTKSIGYFVLLTIANLFVITPQIKIVGTIISTILYVGLAFYELISNLENLRDAKFALNLIVPLIKRFKKEQNNFIDTIKNNETVNEQGDSKQNQSSDVNQNG